MSTSRIALVLACGFLAGVLLRSFYELDIHFVLTTTLLSGALFAIGRRARTGAASVAIVAFFVGAAGLGVLRAESAFVVSDALHAQVGASTELQGVVVAAPEHRPTTTHIVIKVDNASHEYVLLYADRLTAVSYGDFVSVQGTLEYPKAFADTSGTRVFNYPAYLAKDGVRYVVYRPAVHVESSGNGNFVFAFLYSVKDMFAHAVARMLPEPQASLAAGITIGERSALTDYWRDVFIKTGLIHIVVLSGFNITLVAMAVLFVVQSITVRPSVHFIAGALLVCGFVLLTGASSTGIRAGIMAVLAMLARYMRRDFDGLRALLFAGTAMVLFNPYVLVFDPSFQLSIIATFALIYATPVCLRYVQWVPTLFGVRDIAAATLATFVWVLPYLLYLTGNLSFSALPVNLIVLPAIPAAMALVFFGVGATLVVPALAVLWGAGAYVVLSYVLVVAEHVAHIPHASTTVPGFSFWVVLVVYALLFVVFARAQRTIMPVHQNALPKLSS